MQKLVIEPFGKDLPPRHLYIGTRRGEYLHISVAYYLQVQPFPLRVALQFDLFKKLDHPRGDSNPQPPDIVSEFGLEV